MLNLLLLLACSSLLAPAASRSSRLPAVPKWVRFEFQFRSNVAYEHPLQQVTLKVTFTSPLGESRAVYGFWDGGRTWRVRFAPDQPGNWNFRSVCSDPANAGLEAQSGQFLCLAPAGTNRFQRHGPLRVARDGHHLEHQDGTPFFWLADTVGTEAWTAGPKDWLLYASVRASQNFTAVQWTAARGRGVNGESALTGFPDQIEVDPQYFRQLDARLETLSRAGLLTAIAPLWNQEPMGAPGALTRDQAVLLARYMVARWGAEPVAWILSVDAENADKSAEECKSIGHQVFEGIAHNPVLICSQGPAETLEQFRDQDWVDLLGFQTAPESPERPLGANLKQWLAKESESSPARPLIAFLPPENRVAAQRKQRVSSDEVRQAAYSGLLATWPAGLSYAGQGVLDWDTTAGPKGDTSPGAALPLWHKAMFMPAAKQLGCLARMMEATDFWRLRPEPGLLAGSSDGASGGPAFAAASENKDLAIVYVPSRRAVDVLLEAMPPSPVVRWFNPRTGAYNPAVAVVLARTCQFPTPAPGDWALVIKRGK